MKRTYAAQIHPDLQSSYAQSILQGEVTQDDLIIMQTRSCLGLNDDHPELELIFSQYDNMVDWLGDDNGTLAEALDAFRFDPPYGETWTDEDLVTWQKIVDLTREQNHCGEDPTIFVPAMRLLTGIPWQSTCLHGSVQRDWQYALYNPESITKERLKYLEALWFNMGTAWWVETLNEPPETPDDVTGMVVFSTGYDYDDIRRDIAQAEYCDEGDIILYALTRKMMWHYETIE